MIYTATDETSKKRNISVNSVLKKLGVSSSGYYSWKKRVPSKQEQRKRELKTEIKEIYHESKQIYGAPKIAEILRSRGHVVSDKTVGNYMREEGIRAIWVSPYVRTTIDPNFDVKLINVLNRKFNPEKPNAVWVTDVTYVYTLEGFVYLTSVMDLYSRRIIGWNVSDSLATEHVVAAIDKAKASRKLTQPVVIHSDRGSQYVSKEYLESTPAAQYIRSYSNKANPWDNACIESFHALIKREWLHRFVIQDLEHARQLIFEYIDAFYNTVRIHGHCGMKSPIDYEDALAI